ncbi:MAG: alternative ribosome rescue aminoacyl-tRNA hydrolase ArfB [Pseudohongiellaceae bacterium]
MSRYTPAPDELEFNAIRASGPGGQNVNKVASAVELRFSVPDSRLPAAVRQRLLRLGDRRINSDGVVVIKAQRFRSQEQNRQDALERLQVLLDKAARPPKKRVATRPGRGARERRLQEKKEQGDKKSKRKPVNLD